MCLSRTGCTIAAMPNKPVRAPLGRSRRSQLGVVDYTLAKRALLRDARAGLLSSSDLCDAHPELMRAARHVGEPTRSDCPVCGKDKLVLLAYVYGDGLKADNGRVWSIDTGLRMAAAYPGSRCYVVEVCRRCSWNHLREAYSARRTATG
jgi:hypothetical protein